MLTALLLAIGLITVYSISPGLASSQHVTQGYFITKQVIDVGLGLAAFGLAAMLPIGTWRRIAWPLVLAAALGSLIVIFTPVNELYPAHRWIRIGTYSVQVAELIKLALIVYLGGLLADKWPGGRPLNFRDSWQPLAIAVILIGVVVAKFQSDLGSAAVMLAILGLMVYNIGAPLKKIALGIGLIALIVILAISSSAYRRQRISTFLHPQADCQGSGYHACQALISVGSGGLFGKGLGYSVQAYGYTPEAANDSIFAIMAEQVGFVGSILLLGLYGTFIYRLKRIAERTADTFSRLIVIGVLAWLSTQLVINVGAMIGLLPLKGITLPLISQGGTSLVFMTAALGLVFQISRYTDYDVIRSNQPSGQPPAGDYSDRRRQRRPYRTPVVSRPRA